MQRPVAISGPHFYVPAPSERIEFTHPTTDAQHTLTVQEYEQHEMSREHFDSQNQEFPTYCTVMSYTLSPDLSEGAFTVTDCVRSDRPRQKRTDPNEPKALIGNCIGFIVGTDRPTAIIFGGSEQGKLQVVCSALHFEPVDDVEWRMVFHEKSCKDVTVELM